MRHLLNWPVPALLAWFSVWIIYLSLGSAGLSAPWAIVCACAAGVLLSIRGATQAKRWALALGFPLSLLLLQTAVTFIWGWLALLVIAALVYPVRAWRDASVFPTPLNALRRVPTFAPLVDHAPMLDAGCGLGDGLLALRLAYPRACYYGIEASWPLRILASMRCPWAKIWQGDIWDAEWGGYALIYLFQRPGTMNRAVEKAHAELKAGAWLISLEFEAVDLIPTAVVQTGNDRRIWMYQQPFKFLKKTPPRASKRRGTGKKRSA